MRFLLGLFQSLSFAVRRVPALLGTAALVALWACGGGGSKASAPVAPQITTQPAGATVSEGATATFTVVASGTAPLSYQWSKGSTALTGATSASYTTPAAVLADNGSSFTVTVSNAAGQATSSAATLTVNPAPAAPQITTQPADATVSEGATATFTVVASGTAPLGYQWSKNGTAIGAATSDSYTTPATALADSGASYTVSVSNAAGHVTSNAATLTVNPATPSAPLITTQPSSRTVTLGQTATFTVVATGTAPLSYQWSKGSTAISDATFASYTTPAAALTDSGASFTVTVTNGLGHATSTAATLTVTAASAWQPRGIGGGGAQYAPSISPFNASEYYVSCDMSELFHTTDFGHSYSVMPFTQIEGGHYANVGFTSDPSILYSLTYANGNWAMLVKSLDGGATWNLLPNDPLPYDDKWCLFADNTTITRLVTSSYGSIYFTKDGGTNFADIHDGLSGNGLQVAGVFWDGDNIYIGTNDGLLVSTNGGTSFTLQPTPGIPTGQVIASFAGARTGSQIRFFALVADAANVYPLSQPGSNGYGLITGMYQLNGGTGTWTSCSTGIDLNNDYIEYIAMAQNDINTVYGGGGYQGSVPEVMKTSDGGQHWANTFLATGNQNILTGWSGDGGDRGWGYGQNVYGIAVAPFDSTKVVITDEGFTHTTTNGGTTWEQAYVSPADQHSVGDTAIAGASYHSVGLEVTSTWQVFWGDAQHLFACNTDIHGLYSTDGGATWAIPPSSGLDANTTYRVVEDAASGTLYVATSDVHDMYESTHLSTGSPIDDDDAHGDILYSTDQGATWNLLKHFGHPVFWLAQDPNLPHRMYASVVHSTAGGVFVTQDLQNGASATWTLIPNPTRAVGHPACLVVLNDGKLLATFSGERNPDFPPVSGLFVYDPNAKTWSDVSAPNMQYWTKDVVVDPTDAAQNTWLVCAFSGWGTAATGVGGLYRTTDRGAHWTRINALDRVTSITFNPADAEDVYLTTEWEGLWHTNALHTASASVDPFTLVADYPFKQPERVYYNPFTPGEVWVTSFGNGMKVK